jgi:hypothetical protein
LANAAKVADAKLQALPQHLSRLEGWLGCTWYQHTTKLLPSPLRCPLQVTHLIKKGGSVMYRLSKNWLVIFITAISSPIVQANQNESKFKTSWLTQSGKDSRNSLLNRVAITTVLCLSIAGCSKGLDLKPDFTSQETYSEKINKDLKDIGSEKEEAFNWAVDGITFEEIRERYKSSSYRQIAESELDRKAAAVKTRLPEFEKSLKTIADDLAKIRVEISNERIVGDFFGPQFKFDIKVNNDSLRDISKLAWNASLYLDDSSTPVAKTVVWSFYESSGGLKAGQISRETIHVGNITSPADWVTLAVRNAKERKIVLELGNAYDFNNKSIIDSTHEMVEFAQQLPTTVSKLKATLAGPDKLSTASNTASTARQVNRTSCTNNCTNGSCVRTFPDGLQERWQAPRKLDPFTQNWEWDTTTNACGI